jgi:hypothetical protein
MKKLHKCLLYLWPLSVQLVGKLARNEQSEAGEVCLHTTLFVQIVFTIIGRGEKGT